MILYALKEYYDRLAALPESDVAPEGFEKKPLEFLICIKPNGEFVQLEDARDPKGKKMIGKTYLLPRHAERTGSKSYTVTSLLWDHLGYVLGEPADGKYSAKQHESWLAMLRNLPENLKQDPGVRAVLRFYESGEDKKVPASAKWTECLKSKPNNISFKLAGDTVPVPCRPAVQEYVRQNTAAEPAEEDGQEVTGRCLVCGRVGPLARTHGKTPINRDAKCLVSFQKNQGYDSYGKEQAYNAPVIKSTEFAYTTALQSLLKSDQKIRIGSDVYVFWAQKKSALEQELPCAFAAPPTDNPNANTDYVTRLFQAVWKGTYTIAEDNTKFYILGLSPNAYRISVRLWEQGTVKDISGRIVQHMEDLKMTVPGHGYFRDHPALPLDLLMRSIALGEKYDNIPPNLTGQTVQAVLRGLPYPATLLHAAVRRIGAEHTVNYPRAALLKAYLNRARRFAKDTSEKEILMSLDITNTNPGYVLGRLFAVLEKMQEEASGGNLNATIKDRYYGAASSTPRAVFALLLRLNNHHAAKIENPGRRTNLDKLKQEILGLLDAKNAFPAHLSLEDQGRFALGYYHQRQDLFTSKNTDKLTGEKI